MKKYIFIFMALALSVTVFAQDKLKRSISISKKTAVVLTGKNCQIVIAKNATPTEKFAAEELQEFLSSILGSKIAISTRKSTSINIFIGATLAAQANLDVNKLARDGFYLKSIGEDLYIAGRDCKTTNIKRVISNGGAWSFEFERATLYGVYDFLERFCQVRFYFPGELGTIIPKKSQIAIPVHHIVERPDMTRRTYHSWYDGSYFEGKNPDIIKHPKKNLNMLRLRFGTQNMLCCHGTTRFELLKRFGKTHPEYFRLTDAKIRETNPNLRMAGQLCWSSNIANEIQKDIIAYFTNQNPKTRGLSNWSHIAFRSSYVDVMPQDAFSPCFCKNCQAAYIKDKDYASKLIWNHVITWAKELKKNNIKGKLSASAYFPYRKIPKDNIPDNVEVQVCVVGPWVAEKSMQQTDLTLIKNWQKKLSRPVHLWNYVNKHGITKLPGIPAATPKAVGHYYKQVAPYIFGMFMESECDKFIYFAMNYYMMCKVAWNSQIDVDATLNEYYKLMFGKASTIMQKIMEDFENIWIQKIAGRTVDTPLGPVASVPAHNVIWNEIYSPTKLKLLEDEFAKAKKLVKKGSLEYKRIEFFHKEFLKPLYVGSQNFLNQSQAVNGLRFRIPSSTIRLIPFTGKSKTTFGETVDTKVNAKYTKDALVITYDCQEPNFDNTIARVRPKDDPIIWQDNSIEIFLAPNGTRETYYQIIVNTVGSITDFSYKSLGSKAIQDVKWNSNAKVKVNRTKDGFTLEVAIPLKNLGKIKKSGFPVNFCRNRVLKTGKIHPLYIWSPYASGFHDIENYGWMVPDDKEIVAEGNFDDITKRNSVNWGYYKKINNKNTYFGWIAPKPKDGSFCELDNKVYFSAPNSMKIVAANGKGNYISQFFYHKKFKPNTTYKVSCVVKVKDVKPAKTGGGLVINLWDDSNKWYPKNLLTGSSDWTYLSFTFKTSNKVDKSPRSLIRFWLINASGTAWVDDVSVEEVVK